MAYTDISQYEEWIQKYAKQYGVDPELMKVMFLKETGNASATGTKVNPTAVSPKGAYGLGQLMPDTARRLGVDRTNPEDNVRGAAMLLGQLSKKYNGNVALMAAAYNAGEPAVDRNGGIPPYRETQDYVSTILRQYSGRATKSIPTTSQESQPLAAAPMQSAPASKQSLVQEANALSAAALPANVAGAVPSYANNPLMQAATDAANKFDMTPYSDAQQVIKRTADAQQANADAIMGMVSGAPPLPDYTAAANAQVEALKKLYSDSSAKVNTTFDQLQAQDQQRRNLIQNIYDRQDFNPLNPDSAWNKYTTTRGMIARRMDATIKEEQRVADANVVENTGTWLKRIVFGNEYTAGREALQAQANSLDDILGDMKTDLADQAKVGQAIALQDPQILRDRLNADLQLAGIQKDVGIAAAEAPLKAFESQTAAINARAALLTSATGAQTDAANTLIKSQEVSLQGQDARLKAASLPVEAEKALVGLDTAKQGLIQQRAQIAQIPNQIAQQNIALQQQSLQLASQLRVADAEVADRLLQSQVFTAEQQTKLPILKSKLASIKQLEASGQLQTQAGLAALTDYQNTVADFQAASVKATTGSNATAVLAQDAQNKAILNLAPLSEKVSTAEAEGKLKEFAAAARDEDILRSGWQALGLPEKAMPSLSVLQSGRYSKGVLPALGAAAVGGRVAGNTAKAVAVLNEIGAIDPNNAKYPALVSTAGSARQVANSVAKAEGATEGDLDKTLETLDQALINKAFKQLEAQGVNIASISKPTDTYGMLPAAAIRRFTKSQGANAIADFIVSEESAGKTATSYSELITKAKSALEAAGISQPMGQNQAIAEFFRASVEANNNLRGYNLIGVPEQKSVYAKIDRLDLGIGGLTGYKDAVYDLTSVQDIVRLRNIGTLERATNVLSSPMNDVTGGGIWGDFGTPYPFQQ